MLHEKYSMHVRLMTTVTFTGRVNCTRKFRTDNIVAPSETETSQYQAILFTCVGEP